MRFPDIDTLVVVADFSDGQNLKLYDDIYEKVKHLDISILVNNAGLNYRGKFDEVASAQLHEMTIVNTYPYVLLTKKLFNKLRKRSYRSIVVNVCSGLGLFPTPHDGVYSATKAFERFFSESFAFENKFEKTNIDVLTVYPGYVATNNARLETSILVVDPDHFCEYVVKSMGVDETCYGTPIQQVQIRVGHWLEEKLR